jgi:hypothetical protein
LEITAMTTFTRNADAVRFTSHNGEQQTARVISHVRHRDGDTSFWEHCMILGDFREMRERDVAALAGIILGDQEDPHHWNNSYIMRVTEKYALIYHEWGLSV